MKRSALVIAVIVAVFAGFAWWRTRPPEDLRMPTATVNATQPSPASATAPSERGADTARAPFVTPSAADVAERAPASGQTPPPPPPSSPEPFARDAGELRRRADAGDGRAACVLSMQLDTCATLPLMRKSFQLVSSEMRERHSAELANLERQCDGFAPIEPLEAFHRMLAAARAGVVESQLQFAMRPPLNRMELLESEADAWREWAGNALPLLLSALEAGDTHAPAALAQVYKPGHRPFIATDLRIADPDPYSAYVYGRLTALIWEHIEPKDALAAMGMGGLDQLDVDEARRALADKEAELLYHDYYSRLPARLRIGSVENRFENCAE